MRERNLVNNKINLCQDIKNNKSLYAMAIPGMLILISFTYIPYMYLVVAFKKYNFQSGIWGSPWNGFENFRFFFESGNLFRVTFNTVLLNVLFITFNLILQVSMALFVNEAKNKLFKKVTQSMYFFPYFLSWVVIGEIVFNLFSSEYGAINNVLVSIGFKAISWYRHPEYWRTILVLANLWRFTGYGTLVYLASMSGFDTAFYEAAIVEGANRVQCIFKITLPMLKPTMFVLVLFAVGRIFYGDFGMIYGIVRDIGPLLSKTEIIDTYVYRAFRQTGNIGMSVAIGLYQSVFGFIVIVMTNKIAKRFNDGSALF